MLERHGRLDLLVNNAGGQFMSPAEAITPKGFRTVIELNVQGTWLMTHAAATKAFIPQQGGKVISVTLSPHNGMPGMVHSGAARAAVENMMRTLSIEWARFNIKLCALAAGQFATETLMTKYPQVVVDNLERSIPIGRPLGPEEMAWLVAYLASPAGDFFSGTVITIDGARDNWVGPWPPRRTSSAIGSTPAEGAGRTRAALWVGNHGGHGVQDQELLPAHRARGGCLRRHGFATAARDPDSDLHRRDDPVATSRQSPSGRGGVLLPDQRLAGQAAASHRSTSIPGSQPRRAATAPTWSANNYFRHTDLGGHDPSFRAMAAGYPGSGREHRLQHGRLRRHRVVAVPTVAGSPPHKTSSAGRDISRSRNGVVPDGSPGAMGTQDFGTVVANTTGTGLGGDGDSGRRSPRRSAQAAPSLLKQRRQLRRSARERPAVRRSARSTGLPAAPRSQLIIPTNWPPVTLMTWPWT